MSPLGCRVINGPSLHGLQQFDAGHIRHVPVRNDEVETSFTQLGQRRSAVLGFLVLAGLNPWLAILIDRLIVLLVPIVLAPAVVLIGVAAPVARLMRYTKLRSYWPGAPTSSPGRLKPGPYME